MQIVNDRGATLENGTCNVGRTRGYSYKHYRSEITAAGAQDIVTFDPGLQ